MTRQCGIATFTSDLCEAIATQYKQTTCIAFPINDIEAGYDYPAPVRFEIAEKDIDSYRRADHVRGELSTRLLELYQSHSSDKWHWYEDRLTYCNSVLPNAILMSGHAMSNVAMTEAGLESMNWLINLQHADTGYFVPIGSNGFYQQAGERALFDQQPVEAQSTVSACLEAYRITLDEH